MAVSFLTQANEQVPLSPVVVAYVVLGNQPAVIGSTLMLANAPPGIYRASVSLVVNTAGTSGNLVVNVIYTDSAKAETVAVTTLIGITGVIQGNGSLVFENIATANINYSVTASGTLSPGTYNAYIILERIF